MTLSNNHFANESCGASTKSDKPLSLSALAPSFSMTNTGPKMMASLPANANLCHPNMNGKFTTAAAKKPTVHGPSPWRQLLPIAACMLSFATVLSVLIVYMDTTGEFILCQHSLFYKYVLYYLS